MHLGGEIAFADLDGATGLDRLWDAGHHAEEQQEANRCQYATIDHPDRRGEKAPHDQGDTDYQCRGEGVHLRKWIIGSYLK